MDSQNYLAIEVCRLKPTHPDDMLKFCPDFCGQDLAFGSWIECRARQNALMHQGKSTLRHSLTHAEHVQLQEGG